jgi:hypothetical protein
VEAHKPSYYAIIPSDVRYDDSISSSAKLLYGEISALIGKDGFCFASNDYFADLYKTTRETIARQLTKLEKAGHIQRVIEKSDSGQVISRKIYLRVSVPDGWGIDKNVNTPIDENVNTYCQKNQEGIDENVTYTDKSITVKEKDKKEKRKHKPRQEAQPLTDEELRPLVVENINQIAQPDWTAADKNDLYRWLMALYDPERVVKKARPVRSRLSVNGTFRKLQLSGTNPRVMVGMLCTAIEGGWQGVQLPKQPTAPAKPPREEPEYRCI